MDARVEKPTEGGVAPTFYKKYAHIFEFVVYVYICGLPPFKSICVYLNMQYTGFFFNWYPLKKLKYGKPRLGVSTLT